MLRLSMPRSKKSRAKTNHRHAIELLEDRRLFSVVWGTTVNDELISFDSANPSVTSAPIPVQLPLGEHIVGLDFQTSGALYGVTNASHLYRINTTDGSILKVPSPNEATFTTPLSGTAFGVDANPISGNIRVMSNTEQNLDISPATGDLSGSISGGLHYAGTDVHSGGNPNIMAIAFSRNFSGTPNTTLYGLDSQFSSLVTIDPTTGTINTVGPLTVGFGNFGEFDITSQFNGGDFGFAALSADDTTTNFYSINLATGKATLIGKVGDQFSNTLLNGLAVAPVPTQFSFAPTDMAIAENDVAGGVTVTVTRAGVGTSAASVSYRTLDDTATEGFDYTGKTGTLNFAAGEFTKTFFVPITDDNIHEANEIIGLQLFNPSGGTIDAGDGQITILDNDPAAIFGFSRTAFTVREDGSATITVQRSGDISKSNTVDFSTADGTGLVGTDYQGTSGTLTFPAGASSETFTVFPVNDFTFEPNRTVILNLSNPSVGGELAANNAQATLTITDDETQPTLSITGPASVVEGNTDPKTLTYNVTINGLTTQTVTVNFSTSDGTAMAVDEDYVATSGTLTFAPGGPTTQIISVVVNPDTKFEGDETFSVNLSAAANATLQPAQASTTIIDDDAGAKLQADPVNPRKTLLTVVGTPGDDVITVVKSTHRQVEVFLNDTSMGVFANPGRIAVFGKDGNDDISIDPNVHISAELHGDAGDDTLRGSSGRDILLGGTGTDILFGNNGDDILIGGPSIYDNNPSALAAVMREWTSSHSYKKRVNFVAHGGGLNGTTVLNETTIATDGVIDILSGGNGRDFFPFATGDTVTDGRANETGVPTT